MKMHTVHVGGMYEHYKNKKKYEVIDVAEHTEREGEYLVIYHCIEDIGKYGSLKMWARPKAMFEEGMEVNGQMVPRFKLLSPIVANTTE